MATYTSPCSSPKPNDHVGAHGPIYIPNNLESFVIQEGIVWAKACPSSMDCDEEYGVISTCSGCIKGALTSDLNDGE